MKKKFKYLILLLVIFGIFKLFTPDFYSRRSKEDTLFIPIHKPDYYLFTPDLRNNSSWFLPDGFIDFDFPKEFWPDVPPIDSFGMHKSFFLFYCSYSGYIGENWPSNTWYVMNVDQDSGWCFSNRTDFLKFLSKNGVVQNNQKLYSPNVIYDNYIKRGLLPNFISRN